ncbi:hypothetical protein [Arthrobacter gyeryongensis]
MILMDVMFERVAGLDIGKKVGDRVRAHAPGRAVVVTARRARSGP